MIGSDQLLVLVLFFGALIWLLPLLIIILSSKTRGSEKLAWIFAMLFISWFAFILYILLAPIKNRA